MKHPNVCVIGIGRFGRALAIELRARGCHVSAMDKDEAAIESISGQVDFACVGNASDEPTLRRLKLERFDAVYVALGRETLPSLAVAIALGASASEKMICRTSCEAHRFALEKIGCKNALDIEFIAASTIADKWVGSAASREDYCIPHRNGERLKRHAKP